MARPEVSFEYFPPRTEAGRQKLLSETTPALNALGPKYFSCTYGAGGSNRDGTFGLVSDIKAMGMDAAPHLSFGADDAAIVEGLLDGYVELGVKHLIVLRGDLPEGMGSANLVGAGKLVDFVRKRHGDHFHIAVAAYPEIHPKAQGYDSDVQFLRGKFDAGADMAITQFFYNADAYLYFMDRCAAAGIDKPVFAGIMPITNYDRLASFAAKCGAEVPRWICRQLEDYGDDIDSIRAFGVETVGKLCRRLADSGCPGFHFYTMNQAEPTATLYRNLGLD